MQGSATIRTRLAVHDTVARRLAARTALGGAALGTLLAGSTVALAAGDYEIPVKELPDAGERDYWLPEEVNQPGTVENLQEVVGSEPVPLAVEQEDPLQIALIYPSADVSDFWARAYLAFTKRMDQLGIEYETTEFASRQIEHSLQATYTEQVLQDGDLYDFVVFGPSELATQADNIERLVASDDFTTFVWSFSPPSSSSRRSRPAGSTSPPLSARSTCATTSSGVSARASSTRSTAASPASPTTSARATSRPAWRRRATGRRHTGRLFVG